MEGFFFLVAPPPLFSNITIRATHHNVIAPYTSLFVASYDWSSYGYHPEKFFVCLVLFKWKEPCSQMSLGPLCLCLVFCMFVNRWRSVMLVRIRDHLRRASDGTNQSDTSVACTVCCIFVPRVSSPISQTATVGSWVHEVIFIFIVLSKMGRIFKCLFFSGSIICCQNSFWDY